MPASVYEVAVVSRNRFGWSDSSKVIRFATSGESKYVPCSLCSYYAPSHVWLWISNLIRIMHFFTCFSN